MLDVIVTISDTTDPNFVRQALRSVKAAIAICPYPVNLIQTPGVPGHIGKAMLGGLTKSTAPYVAWVDDDDFVLPNAFSCLHRHFSEHPTAICAREIHLLANGHLTPSYRQHHLTAYSRDALAIHAFDHPSKPNEVLLTTIAPTAVDELSWVYVHRIRRSAASRLRGTHP